MIYFPYINLDSFYMRTILQKNNQCRRCISYTIYIYSILYSILYLQITFKRKIQMHIIRTFNQVLLDFNPSLLAGWSDPWTLLGVETTFTPSQHNIALMTSKIKVVPNTFEERGQSFFQHKSFPQKLGEKKKIKPSQIPKDSDFFPQKQIPGNSLRPFGMVKTWPLQKGCWWKVTAWITWDTLSLPNILPNRKAVFQPSILRGFASFREVIFFSLPGTFLVDKTCEIPWTSLATFPSPQRPG